MPIVKPLKEFSTDKVIAFFLEPIDPNSDARWGNLTIPLEGILPADTKVRRLWTVPEHVGHKAYTNKWEGFTPKHQYNAFLEDQMHDWYMRKTNLNYAGLGRAEGGAYIYMELEQ